MIDDGPKVRLTQSGSCGSLKRLTRREREVLAVLATGARTRAIAAQLGITDATVKRHLTHLYEKLGAHNRVEAVRYYLVAELGEGVPDKPRAHDDRSSVA